MKRILPYLSLFFAALLLSLPFSLRAQESTSSDAASPAASASADVSADASPSISVPSSLADTPSASESGEARLRAGLSLPTKAEADSAYASEDFQTAAEYYQLLLDSCGGSAQLYYNLGNCYYRLDSIARAILNYERARLFDPSDDDIRFNLEMARAKTVDRVMPASEMFFVAMFHRIVLSQSLQIWAWLGLLTFIVMLVAIAAYVFLPTLHGKKAGFTIAVISLIVCIFANVAAFQQLHQLENRSSAVIMSSSVVIKSTPSQAGTDLFILHEGTRVEIEDNSMKEWVEIRMSDGKEGWLQRSDIEII